MDRMSLTALLAEHLTVARATPSGRSAHTVYGGHERTLRQTLVALAAGQRLDEHENPGEATLQVLHGQVRLVAGDTSCEGTPGDILVIPDARHALEAISDAGILLTVAKR